MFFEQLSKLCEEKNTTPTKFVTDVLHLSSSKVTAWKNGSIPKYEILIAIAQYFSVTVGTLFDGKNAINESDRINNDIKVVDSNEKVMLDLFRKLSEKEQDRIIGRLEVMVEQSDNVKRKEAI